MILPIVLAAALQAVAGWPWVGAANPPAHVLKPGLATVIQGRWNGKPVTVRLEEAAVPQCHLAGWLHGAAPDRQDRCTRLGRLDISVAGRAMAISGSGYADLGGVNDVVVRFTAARLTIYMRGPDGPDYYGATLVFDHRDIVSRRLDLADGGREITTYAPAPPGGGL